jgi:anti-sigma28 factor (negative regulator of flagellin synthesis)
MKIENSGLLPLSSKSTETSSRIEKKDERKELQTVRSGQDVAEMSGNSRLLAKARASLGNVAETNSARLGLLKEQVASGAYTIQLKDLAQKLVARFYPK